MGPKIESLFKFSTGFVLGTHFWGPLLESILGPQFFRFCFSRYFLNRLRVKLFDLNTQARAELPRSHFSSLGLALKVGPEIGPRSKLKFSPGMHHNLCERL